MRNFGAPSRYFRSFRHAQRTTRASRSIGEYLVSTSFSAGDLHMKGWKASVFDARWTITAPRPVMLASTTTSVSRPMTKWCNSENSLSESCSLRNASWHFLSQAQTFSLSFCRKGWTILAKFRKKRSLKPAISRKERNSALLVGCSRLVDSVHSSGLALCHAC